VATPQPPTASRRTNKAASGGDAWHYTPSRFTLLWLAISLPLVIWDTIYILGRPHTMEGGWLHWPLFVPYELYGEVDHVYGWKAFNAHSGFSAAQGFLNAIETLMYLAFLRAAYNQGWALTGRQGAKPLTIGLSAAVMTLSKTVLYCELLCLWSQSVYFEVSRGPLADNAAAQGPTSTIAASTASATTLRSTSSSSGSSPSK
jgi:hypothetical protein